MPITTDLDRFRLELGDTDAAAPLLQDDEAQYFIDKHPTNVLLAVADACDALAARFARQFDFDANDQKSFKRSQMATLYAERATALRARALAEGDGSGGAAGAILDLEFARIVLGTPFTATATFRVDEIPTDADGAVAVTVTRENGEAVTSGAGESTSADGQYSFLLTGAAIAAADMLTLTWAATVDGEAHTLTTRVEVRGALLFSVTAARGLIPLDDIEAFPTSRIVEVRTLAETALEDVCKVAFAPTYFRVRIDERCARADLLLPFTRPLTITAATIGVEEVDDLASLELDPAGVVRRDAGWGYGQRVIELTGTYGYEIPPPMVRRGCLMLARHYLVDAPGCDLAAAVFEVPEAAAVVNAYGMRRAYSVR